MEKDSVCLHYSPEFASNLKAFNISQYTKQNSSKNARAYLENYFPELNQFYVIVTGEQRINSSNNVSILSLSPSKFESYLKKLNITRLNSSFPINATNLLYNKSYQKLGKYLPSEMFFINMSNNVGVEMISLPFIVIFPQVLITVYLISCISMCCLLKNMMH